MENSTIKNWIKYKAGTVCLTGILIATFLHTASFMSTFFYGSIVLGAVAAFAIDIGVVAMSTFKDEMIKDGEVGWMIRGITVLVLIVSGIANMSEGFKSAYDMALTWQSLMDLDPLSWTQWIAGTLVFPVLAYIMTDTIAYRNMQQLREEQGQLDTSDLDGLLMRYEPMPYSVGDDKQPSVRQQKAIGKTQRKQMALDIYKKNPDLPVAEIARRVGVQPQTVRGYFKEMKISTEAENLLDKYSAN